MPPRWAVTGVIGLLTLPLTAAAAEKEAPLDLPVWTALPFVLLLLAIAVLPLVAGHFWHRNRNKALVAALLALPVAGYLIYLGPETGQRSTHALVHELEQYLSFILLLACLYSVSGGIVLQGDIAARPLTNTGLLALGAVLANFIGTTGASMLLIRPVLRINRQRQRTGHVPLFFIFTVSNLGGLLTPLGDPPLFLGFLNGVDFFWTLALWPQWLVANGVVLTVFLVWDTLAYRREERQAVAADLRQIEPLRVRGLVNFLFLGGVLAAVVLQPVLPRYASEALMAAMGLLSLGLTPRDLRQANGFSWGPIVEVALLFAGIFVTMVPALALLRVHGPRFGVTEPWQYFWLTGSLSSFLDNAPTYLTFASMAAGPHDFAWLSQQEPLLLAAISCGAVFMGANTYIGNGPNFMVKAIADEAGVRTPSFFGYMAYSGLILLPVFVLITWLFFPPGAGGR
jgi:Na+/H+ antiporter NhaD/arsenite permease-like protein